MTTVVKIGGRAQGDARLASLLAARWHAHPGALVMVHGGGDEVSALQRAAGVEPVFVGGRRVTAPDDIDRLRMALSGLANKRLVAALVAAGLDAVGVSGEDAGLLVAAVADNGALGRVGTVQTVRRALLAHLLSGGYLPVVSPLATPGLNANGDDAASAVAVALKVEELLFVSDVPAVRVGGAPVARIDATDAAVAMDSGEIGGGMAAKIQAALGAIAGGVASVRIGDLAIINDTEAGTTVVALAAGAVS
jgi:acetylglutamate kinase